MDDNIYTTILNAFDRMPKSKVANSSDEWINLAQLGLNLKQESNSSAV